MYDEFVREDTKRIKFSDLAPRNISEDNGNAICISYAAFFLNYKQPSGKFYAVNTVLEYYKGWMNKLQKKKGSWRKTVEEAKKDWWGELLTKLQMRASVATIKCGESVNKKTKSIRRKMMKNIIKHILRGTTGNTVSAFEDRFVLSMLRSAVGRSGEVSTANWKFADWCDEAEMLIMEWPEEKTGHSTVLSFGPDADCWELCVIHSLACYLITSVGFAGPDDGDTSWILPRYARFVKGGANKRANSIIKTCVGWVSVSFALYN